MNHLKLLFLGIGLLVFCCNQIKKDGESVTSADSSGIIANADKEELLKLIKQLYEWYETDGFKGEFIPVADSVSQKYTGLDYAVHNERLCELRQTDFFTEEFLGNYHKIALTIDEKLKKNEIEWLVGDLPPFGNDASPWCNCQDAPHEYWEKITINEVVFDQEKATFIWTWGKWGDDDFKYHVKAIKEHDIWKIVYLQGFDYNEFIRTLDA